MRHFCGIAKKPTPERAADQGTFYDGATEFTGNALTGEDLTDVYWEGEYRPDLDVTVTLSLKIKEVSEPLVITRNVRSRELQRGIKDDDDVRMLQALLRTIGISQGGCAKCYGWRGTPVDIDGIFGGGVERAVDRLRYRDEIRETGIVDLTALQKIQEHWHDYLAAFEAYPTEPIINELVPDPATHFEVWLDAGAEKLAETLTDTYMSQISSTVTRKDILRAWVTKEAEAGHWGYKDNWTAGRKVPYRIVLGGSDNNGSIGFSQIQNRFKYGQGEKKP